MKEEEYGNSMNNQDKYYQYQMHNEDDQKGGFSTNAYAYGNENYSNNIPNPKPGFGKKIEMDLEVENLEQQQEE